MHPMAGPLTTSYERCGLFRVGDSNAAQSPEYSFKTGKAVGPSSLPARIGLIADLGITSNSSVSLKHLAANNPEIALFVGGVPLLSIEFALPQRGKFVPSFSGVSAGGYGVFWPVPIVLHWRCRSNFILAC